MGIKRISAAVCAAFALVGLAGCAQKSDAPQEPPASASQSHLPSLEKKLLDAEFVYTAQQLRDGCVEQARNTTGVTGAKELTDEGLVLENGLFWTMGFFDTESERLEWECVVDNEGNVVIGHDKELTAQKLYLLFKCQQFLESESPGSTIEVDDFGDLSIGPNLEDRMVVVTPALWHKADGTTTEALLSCDIDDETFEVFAHDLMEKQAGTE